MSRRTDNEGTISRRKDGRCEARLSLLERGAYLSDRGTLVTPGDVFFLSPDEVDTLARQDMEDVQELINQRKREYGYWAGKTPPPTIGAASTEAGPPTNRGSVIKGIGPGRGVVTARARIIRDLSESENLTPGEVLACRMTSPAWTPLFATAAVVTEIGGELRVIPRLRQGNTVDLVSLQQQVRPV